MKVSSTHGHTQMVSAAAWSEEDTVAQHAWVDRMAGMCLRWDGAGWGRRALDIVARSGEYMGVT